MTSSETSMRNLVTLILLGALLLAGPAAAKEESDPDPEFGPEAVALDLVLVRPIYFVVTVVGTAMFAVSAPIVALGDGKKGIKRSWEKLVLLPASWTFERPIGVF